MSDWYYKIGEQVVGPMSADQLRALATGGRLAPSDPVANAKEGPWVPASRVKGLFAPASVEEEPKASEAVQPAQASEGPPIPQPPVVMPAGMSGAHPSSAPPVGEPSPAPGPPVQEEAAPGGFAIQTEHVAAGERLHKKKKRVKKPKEPLTKKQKNARLVKWLAVGIVAGIVFFACIPTLRSLLRKTPESTPVKKPVATDVDLDKGDSSLEDAFAPSSQPARSAVPASPAAPKADVLAVPAKAEEETVTFAAPSGEVEVTPIEAKLDLPLMTSPAGGRVRPKHPYLVVTLELKTKSPDASVRFRGWAGAIRDITLTDDAGRKYEACGPSRFSGSYADGQCRETTFVTADEPTTDVLIFSWPKGEAPELPSGSDEELVLRVPKSVYGEQGYFNVKIPLSVIQVTEEALEKTSEQPPEEGAATSDNVDEDHGGPIPIPGVTEKH